MVPEVVSDIDEQPHAAQRRGEGRYGQRRRYFVQQHLVACKRLLRLSDTFPTGFSDLSNFEMISVKMPCMPLTAGRSRARFLKDGL